MLADRVWLRYKGSVMKRVELIAFPTDDAAFEVHVRRAQKSTGTADVDGFVERIRSHLVAMRRLEIEVGAR